MKEVQETPSAMFLGLGANYVACFVDRTLFHQALWFLLSIDGLPSAAIVRTTPPPTIEL
jgi:hypothetical protein